MSLGRSEYFLLHWQSSEAESTAGANCSICPPAPQSQQDLIVARIIASDGDSSRTTVVDYSERSICSLSCCIQSSCVTRQHLACPMHVRRRIKSLITQIDPRGPRNKKPQIDTGGLADESKKSRSDDRRTVR